MDVDNAETGGAQPWVDTENPHRLVQLLLKG